MAKAVKIPIEAELGQLKSQLAKMQKDLDKFRSSEAKKTSQNEKKIQQEKFIIQKKGITKSELATRKTLANKIKLEKQAGQELVNIQKIALRKGLINEKTFAKQSLKIKKDLNKQIASINKGQAGSSASSIIGGLGASVGIAGMLTGLHSLAKSSSDAQNKITALSSVIKNKLGAGAVKPAIQAIDELTKTGLMDPSEASESMKNLVNFGMTIDQATNFLKANTDMAVKNKQAHYSVGEAVQKLTEGIKNNISSLADATGVSTNLSVMYKQAGLSANDLNDATKEGAKVQAIYNGFMKEASVFAGDAERASQSYTGATAKLGSSFTKLKNNIGATIGGALTPLTNALNSLVVGASKVFGSLSNASKSILVLSTVLGGLAIALWGLLPAIGALIPAFATLSIPLAPILLIVGAVAGLTIGIGALYNALRDPTPKEQLATIQKQNDEYKKQSNEIDKLTKQFNILYGKEKKTTKEKIKLANIQNKLIKQSKEFRKAMLDENATAESLKKALDKTKEIRQAKEQEQALKLEETALKQLLDTKNNLQKYESIKNTEVKNNQGRFDSTGKELYSQENADKQVLVEQKALLTKIGLEKEIADIKGDATKSIELNNQLLNDNIKAKEVMIAKQTFSNFKESELKDALASHEAGQQAINDRKEEDVALTEMEQLAMDRLGVRITAIKQLLASKKESKKKPPPPGKRGGSPLAEDDYLLGELSKKLKSTQAEFDKFAKSSTALYNQDPKIARARLKLIETQKLAIQEAQQEIDGFYKEGLDKELSSIDKSEKQFKKKIISIGDGLAEQGRKSAVDYVSKFNKGLINPIGQFNNTDKVIAILTKKAKQGIAGAQVALDQTKIQVAFETLPLNPEERDKEIERLSKMPGALGAAFKKVWLELGKRSIATEVDKLNAKINAVTETLGKVQGGLNGVRDGLLAIRDGKNNFDKITGAVKGLGESVSAIPGPIGEIGKSVVAVINVFQTLKDIGGILNDILTGRAEKEERARKEKEKSIEAAKRAKELEQKQNELILTRLEITNKLYAIEKKRQDLVMRDLENQKKLNGLKYGDTIEADKKNLDETKKAGEDIQKQLAQGGLAGVNAFTEKGREELAGRISGTDTASADMQEIATILKRVQSGAISKSRSVSDSELNSVLVDIKKAKDINTKLGLGINFRNIDDRILKIMSARSKYENLSLGQRELASKYKGKTKTEAENIANTIIKSNDNTNFNTDKYKSLGESVGISNEFAKAKKGLDSLFGNVIDQIESKTTGAIDVKTEQLQSALDLGIEYEQAKKDLSVKEQQANLDRYADMIADKDLTLAGNETLIDSEAERMKVAEEQTKNTIENLNKQIKFGANVLAESGYRKLINAINNKDEGYRKSQLEVLLSQVDALHSIQKTSEDTAKNTQVKAGESTQKFIDVGLGGLFARGFGFQQSQIKPENIKLPDETSSTIQMLSTLKDKSFQEQTAENTKETVRILERLYELLSNKNQISAIELDTAIREMIINTTQSIQDISA